MTSPRYSPGREPKNPMSDTHHFDPHSVSLRDTNRTRRRISLTEEYLRSHDHGLSAQPSSRVSDPRSYNPRLNNGAFTSTANPLIAEAVEAVPAMQLANVEVVRCKHCDQVFTGKWANRNHARHIETKHDVDAIAPFRCTVCSRSYKRSDALLTHERKAHPQLKRQPPIPRKRYSLGEDDLPTIDRKLSYSPDRGDPYEHDLLGERATRTRSHSNIDNASAAFGIGDECSMIIKVSDFPERKGAVTRSFIVQAARNSPGYWEYQLEDIPGKVYEDGRWYPESSLFSHSNSLNTTIYEGRMLDHLNDRSLLRRFEVFRRVPLGNFSTLQDLILSLEEKERPYFCSTFFTHWADILEILRDRGSNTHLAFRQVLADARSNHWGSEVYDYVVTLPGTHGGTSTQRSLAAPELHSLMPSTAPRTRPIQGHRTSEPMSTMSLQGDGGSTEFATLQRETRANGNSGTNCNATIKFASKNNDAPSKKMDCPVHKHLLMLNRRSHCGAGNFTNLSQVRHHLQPGRVRAHTSFPRFLRCCKTCKDYFMDGNDWIDHQLGACVNNINHRREEGKVKSWARLYVALYPEATVVPSPFTGENSWLSLKVSDLVASHIRFPTPSSPTSNNNSTSFLDHERISQRELTTPTSVLESEIQNVNQFEYEAAYAIVLRDAVAHTSRILEEGEQNLRPDLLEQIVTRVEEESRVQIGRLRPFQSTPSQVYLSTSSILDLPQPSSAVNSSDELYTPDPDTCFPSDDSLDEIEPALAAQPTSSQSYYKDFSEPSMRSYSHSILPSSSYNTNPSSVEENMDIWTLLDSSKPPSPEIGYNPFPSIQLRSPTNNTPRLNVTYVQGGGEDSDVE